MVQAHRVEYPSQRAAIESIAPKIGCVPQTLNEWVQPAEADAGVHEGVTTSEAQRVKDLKREAKELRKANEILKLPSAFFVPRRSRAADRSRESFHQPAPQCLWSRAALQGIAGRPVRILKTCCTVSQAP